MIDDDDAAAAAAAGGGGNGDWTPVSTPWGLLQEHVRATLIAGDYFGGANPPFLTSEAFSQSCLKQTFHGAELVNMRMKLCVS